MTFVTLAIVSVAALAGPLLALKKSWHIPIVVGELFVGILLGATGLHIVDAHDPILSFLAELGFALVMFVAGSRVPVRDAAVRSAVGAGLIRLVVVAGISTAIGVLVATAFGNSHAPLYAVLMASSSAALILPIIGGLGLGGRRVLQMTAQVAIADVACIVAVPLVVDPAHAGRAAVGSLVVIVCSVALFFVLNAAEQSGLRHRMHKVSEQREFALELRIDLIILFALAALAVFAGISVMLAGFALGLVIAGVGVPRRLARQVFAITEGFLGPLFFVWLGASLDLTGLWAEPRFMLLGFVLGGGALIAHLATRLVGQPVSLGLLSGAQLGVPVAAVTVGTQTGMLSSAEAGAVIVGALVTVVVATVSGGSASRRGFTTKSADRVEKA
ncbi:cation:proton antiporter [Diaminobutyricibacter sp. McL0608]|uniref:cation:proton antiporter n=1 Tax=Leifsonia sp. McL0608 TaxID=3143537 RepID=UPI0031F31DF2